MSENEIKERNLNIQSNIPEDEKIIKFPFHGKSKYLIDKLYIIGYNNDTLNKCLIKSDNYKIKLVTDPSLKIRRSNTKIYQSSSKEVMSVENNIDSFSIKEPPSLINEILNDYNKKVLDIDITLDMIFPNRPIFYSVKEPKRQLSPQKHRDKDRRNTNFFEIKAELGNNFNREEEIKEAIEQKKYCIVFSSNPQLDKNDKKSINGFCYINYCKYKEKKLVVDNSYSFYVPVGICFISEYPYYNSYYKLAEQIFLLFNSKKIEVPIEIMLSNLINATLSPINGDIDLCIEPVSFINNIMTGKSSSLSNKEINNSEKIKNEDKKDEKEITPFNINENQIISQENFSDSTKVLFHVEKKALNKINIRSSLRKSDITKNTDLYSLLKTKTIGGAKKNKPQNVNSFEQIKFPFLQAYPLLQYNLPELLFNYFSISKIIFIFINLLFSS